MAGSVNKGDSFMIASFLSNVSDLKSDGCWQWTGIQNSNGYGRFPIGNKQRLAHRVSYEIFFGEIPEGMLVCHHCDNRLCVRPSHFWLGTQSENLKDASRKGRMKTPDTRASKNGNASLTCDKVRKIREMHNAGTRKFHLAELFCVSPSTIGNIINQDTWKDL